MVGVEGGAREGAVIRVRGIVQAVGFRPFVYRLASEMGLDGVVRNVAGRVEIEVGGSASDLVRFVDRLRSEAPPRARVEAVESATLA